MHKRILSGLLAVWMLLTPALAVGDTPAAETPDTAAADQAAPDAAQDGETAAEPNEGELPPVQEEEPPAEQPEPQAPLFSDLSGHWAEQTLLRASELGLMQGTDGKMQPDRLVTAAEVVVMLNRALGAVMRQGLSGGALPNAPLGAWYRADLEIAVSNGLLDAADGRDFEAGATRAEAFVLLARAFTYENAEYDGSALARFSDAGVMSQQQRAAADALLSMGVVQGDASGKLRPAAAMTRAEFMTMLLRIVPNFPEQTDGLEQLSGGALLRLPEVTLAGVSPAGDLIFGAPTKQVTLSDVQANNRVVLRGEQGVSLTAKDGTAISVLAANLPAASELALESGSSADTLVLAGSGGSVRFGGAARRVEITASGRKIDLYNIDADTLVVSGANNEITVDGNVRTVKVLSGGQNTTLSLSGKAEVVTVAGRGSRIGGSGKAASVDVRAVGCDISLAADSKLENIDKGLSGTEIVFGVPTKVTPGGSLVAQAKVTGVSEDKVCTVQWYQDGKALDGYQNANFLVEEGAFSRITRTFTFQKGMAKSVTMGFKITYFNPSTGETEELYDEVSVPIENYSDEWYYQRDVNRVLNLVSPTYRGNYTTAYAINNDYKSYEKEIFVNAKGYSSNSKYLIWINRAYQHVNVFTGSKGNWKLHKSFLAGTGASSSPTPTGITTVSYKSAGGWNTATYTVKPVVGFYPGTGYAFHTRLFYPGTTTVSDASIGFPVSHGCIRMYTPDVQWIYDTIPIGTAVVIY